MLETIVWAILLNDKKVFLLKSKEEWALVGGHVEINESLKEALHREIIEETGVEVTEEDLKFQCVIDRKLDKVHKIHFFFKATNWLGTPVNKETHKHLAGEWHSLNNLPHNLGPLATYAIQSLDEKENYYEYGSAT